MSTRVLPFSKSCPITLLLMGISLSIGGNGIAVVIRTSMLISTIDAYYFIMNNGKETISFYL